MKIIALTTVLALFFSCCTSEYCKSNDALEIKYVKRYTYGFHEFDPERGDHRLTGRIEYFALKNYCESRIDDTLYLKSISGLLDSATLLLVDTIKELKLSYGVPIFYVKNTPCTERSKWDEGEDLSQKCEGDDLKIGSRYVSYVNDTLVLEYALGTRHKKNVKRKFLKKEGKYIECFGQ
jgi:hypothetical protein